MENEDEKRWLMEPMEAKCKMMEGGRMMKRTDG